MSVGDRAGSEGRQGGNTGHAGTRVEAVVGGKGRTATQQMGTIRTHTNAGGSVKNAARDQHPTSNPMHSMSSGVPEKYDERQRGKVGKKGSKGRGGR